MTPEPTDPWLAPTGITAEDLDDLASFTGMDPEACLARLRSYSPRELAEHWRRADPRTEQEMLRFYRSADLYVWELMRWHATPARERYREALRTLVERFPPDRAPLVLDYGCGVGTDALYLAPRGYDVTLVDVDGPALRFARHRFARRGLRARFLVSDSVLPSPDRTYDSVVCLDVLEHLLEPLEAARRLVAAIRPGGALLQVAGFSDAGDHPCHLSDGVRRYGGLAWHAHLAGMGLVDEHGGILYRRARGAVALAQRARHALWRATGLWIVAVPRRGGGAAAGGRRALAP